MLKNSMKWCTLIILIFSGTLINAQSIPPQEAMKSMKWRSVGPANMGGRVTDVAGIPGDYSTFYFAGADGGIFKTTNGGVTFDALFQNERVLSVGAIGLAPSNTDIIYIGTGEGDPRNSVQYGNGVYRSDDGGKTWDHRGLPKTERIKRILVHPTNPDWACVCALGREWGPNPERGVFKTTDGGKNWKKVLHIDEDHGCSDVAMEPGNPDVLYAGMWYFRRKPWLFTDGGHQTAAYKSTDGGETWKKIMNGLPDQPMARIGFSVSKSSPNIVYMITEFKDAGILFKSENRGEEWTMVNPDPNLNFRPFYYSDVRVDPNNPDVLYTLSGRLSKSVDGGKTFERIGGSVHGDHQALWIDPTNSNRIISGSDGGYQLSFDGGETFDIINNVVLSQYYQIFLDDKEPYNIYGGLQDNGTWYGPSNSLDNAGIMKRHWRKLAGGDGYYAVPIPGEEHEVYSNLQGGVIFHVDTRYGNIRNIHPYPKIIGSAGDAIFDHKYRFNWDSPIHVSPNDPNTVYFGGNVLFRSTDRGYTWEEISPDLTTNDKSKQQSSGGEIYSDNTAAEFHCTILAIAESPLDKNVIWVGTDDGNIQLTKDGGKTWTKLNDKIPGLPAFSWISKIDASVHTPGTAFIAVDQHRLDDFKPYIFITTDFGETWTKAVNGLPEDDYVRVVRQNPNNPNFLVAGMETAIYGSWDYGKNWVKMNNNLPSASVHDLQFQKRESDIVVATHGRGIWILDDAKALENYNNVGNKSLHVFDPKPATLWHYYTQIEDLGEKVYRAPNPEFGAYINFYLANKPSEDVTVSITNAKGELVRDLTFDKGDAGLNRVIWDLRYNGPTPLSGAPTTGWGSFTSGPRVPPGMYTAKLTANGQSQAVKIEVKADPRINLQPNYYAQKDQTLKEFMILLGSANEMINATTAINEQLGELNKGLEAGSIENRSNVLSDVKSALQKVLDLDEELRRPPNSMTYRTKPRLREEIMAIMNAIDGATARPTDQQVGRIVELQADTKMVTRMLQDFIETELAQINAKLAGPDAIKIDLEKRE
ncbi:VPS10 domain-containing protein [Peijinzhouia sedimentorum]